MSNLIFTQISPVINFASRFFKVICCCLSSVTAFSICSKVSSITAGIFKSGMATYNSPRFFHHSVPFAGGCSHRVSGTCDSLQILHSSGRRLLQPERSGILPTGPFTRLKKSNGKIYCLKSAASIIPRRMLAAPHR